VAIRQFPMSAFLESDVRPHCGALGNSGFPVAEKPRFSGDGLIRHCLGVSLLANWRRDLSPKLVASHNESQSKEMWFLSTLYLLAFVSLPVALAAGWWVSLRSPRFHTPKWQSLFYSSGLCAATANLILFWGFVV
jgi:hypothetical protein